MTVRASRLRRAARVSAQTSDAHRAFHAHAGDSSSISGVASSGTRAVGVAAERDHYDVPDEAPEGWPGS